MKELYSHDERLTSFSEPASQYTIQITDEKEVVEELVGASKAILIALEILAVSSRVTGDGIAGSSL